MGWRDARAAWRRYPLLFLLWLASFVLIVLSLVQVFRGDHLGLFYLVGLVLLFAHYWLVRRVTQAGHGK